MADDPRPAVVDPVVAESLRLLDLIVKAARETDPWRALLADEDRAVELIATIIAHDNGRANWHARDWSNASAVLAALRREVAHQGRSVRKG